MIKLKLHWQILIALVLAAIAGSLAGTDGALLGVKFYDVFDFIGTLFLNALKMLIVPLVVSSIIVGIAGIGSGGAFGRLGLKTLLYYITTSLLAILVGLVIVNLVAPGMVNGEPAKHLIGLSENAGDVVAKVEGKGTGDLVEIFLRMVPTNVVAAAADGQMLGLIFFSLLFGFFMTKIEEAYAESMYNFWQGLFQVMMKITDWVMKFAPIGVFGLVAKVIASTGYGAFIPLAWFFLSVVGGLAVHFLVVLPLLLAFVGRVNPLRHYRAMAPALLTAFSTSSSAATLPLTMECVEKNAGVSNRTSSFVLPLGATVNMDGTALYECVAAMFIAQAYGIELGFVQQFTIVLMALVTSIGVAAIPSASLVAIAIILAAIGLPVEAIGLILAVDRVLDMCRTSVNVFSDSCGAVIIARLSGEKGVLAEPPLQRV
ncbi:MAG: dicarboxylate/amino acid:cation symporter [Sulfurimicrobium sp.]|nr:dicarboxylate/amino acid:cation symporter [Sulfurimicrobium sp.]MDO9190337.1 dicarboxylate/amino acid:cation symporter [Sulfurimicrobium sp.]MDP1703811.1 dicarboxylate/amino acid:cation symporter [Sulfurimicrobium sp.]MDP1896988.1 dicarboxylate/amino acid:cation symporter [Sulfurimicrobium sp.]MDP2200060.1 dicarboxylate/amino acid:cation symporter [Sulfurimicrobium sp.]